MRIDHAVETVISRSIRARQVEAAFDVPPAEKCRMEWHGDVDLDAQPWQVGLIVGPSGAGKSTLARKMFGDAVDRPLVWSGASVIDDFDPRFSVEDVTKACSAVGFNTIPAWLRPYAVLSTGEKFRVDLARRLLEGGDLVVVDEFTSVVDRQVAKIGAHAVQKWVRKTPGKRFVAVTCHHDVVDWLQPDWVLEPASMTFARRSLQRRPPVECSVQRVRPDAWRLFAPFHYLTRDVHPAAFFYCLFVGDQPAALVACLRRPHPQRKNLWAVSRIVTLPDWQGLGLAFVLAEEVAAAYAALGYSLRNYPAHPAYIVAHQRNPRWRQTKSGGAYVDASLTETRGYVDHSRPCATFEWTGGVTANGHAYTFREAIDLLAGVEPFNARRWVKKG